MLIKTHRDNWSPLTSIQIGGIGVIVYRDRYKDVAVDLARPADVAVLLEASAAKSIEVDESAREQLAAHGLTLTATGAVVAVELKTLEPRKLGEGEQLEEAELAAAAGGEPVAAPVAGEDDEDDDEDDEDDDQGDDDPERPAHEDPPAAAGRAGRGRRGGRKGKSKAGGGRA